MEKIVQFSTIQDVNSFYENKPQFKSKTTLVQNATGFYLLEEIDLDDYASLKVAEKEKKIQFDIADREELIVDLRDRVSKLEKENEQNAIKILKWYIQNIQEVFDSSEYRWVNITTKQAYKGIWKYKELYKIFRKEKENGINT